MKKFKLQLKIKYRKILSFVLSTVLVAGVINMPFSAVAAEEEPTGRTFSFVGNSTSMSDNSIYVFPGDTLVCEASGERNTLLNVKFKTIVPEAAGYTEIGKTDQFSIEYARNTSMEYDSYIYILSREDEPFLDTDSNYVWNITLDAYPGFQIIYHDKDDKAINEWGSHFYFLALNAEEEVSVSSDSSMDFDMSLDYDEDLGGQIGWSTTTGYIDRDNNDGGLYISAEEGPAYLFEEELFDAGMSKESNGVLNLYPVFYFMPSTLSVSIEDYVEGEDISVSVETNRTDDYTIEYAKANGDGTYTTLSAAPTEPGDYRATVSFPETETQLVEGEYSMEVVKRGFTAISASDEYSIIQKAELTKIPSANELTYNGEAQALVTAGEAEGGEVLYSISEDGTYATDIPTGKEAGTYEVWYILKDSRDVFVSDPESLEITVAPKTIGITWSDTSFTYDGEEHIPSATATGLIEDDTCTINVTGGNTEAGTYTAAATGISNTNYILPDDTEVTYTIARSESAISDKPAGKTLTYNGENQSLIDAGEAEGGSLVYSLTEDGEYTSTIPAGKSAGEYTVWYMVKGDANHADSDRDSVTVTINPKTTGITWSDTSFTYDGNEHVPSAVITDICDGDICEATVSGGESEVGSYTARVTAISNANYVLPDDTEVIYTIAQSESAIVEEPSGKTLTYNGENQSLINTGEAEGGSLVYSLTEDGEYTSTIPAGKNAGEYTVWYMVKGDSNHADSDRDSVTVTINPKTIGITWSDTSFTFDGSEHAPSAVATGLIEGDTCTVNVTGGQTEAGTYTATATGLSNSDYSLPESSEEIAIEYVINGNNEEDNEEEGKEEQEDPSEEEQKQEENPSEEEQKQEENPSEEEQKDDPAEEEQKQEENPSEEEQKDDPAEEEQKQEENPSEEEQKDDPAEEEQKDDPAEEEQKQEENPSGEEQKDDPAEEEQKQEENPSEEEQKQEDNPSGEEQKQEENPAEEEQKQEDNPSEEEQKQEDNPSGEEQKQEEKPAEEEKKDDSTGNEPKEEPDTAPKTEEDIKTAPNEPKTPVQPGYLDKNSRFPDGSYRRSDSSVNVSMQDFIYGEKMPAPIITSGTNDVSKATISYERKINDNAKVNVYTPKEAGDYIVTVILPMNDEYFGCSSSADFSIRYLPVPNDAYAIDGKNGNDGWYKSVVEIKPAKGYEISLGNRNNFSSEPIKISDSLKGGSIYLRDAIKGGQSAAILLGNILIDTKAPTVNNISEDNICYGDKDGNINITVSDENFSHVEVNGRKISIKDEGEGKYSFSLTAGKKKENVDFSVYDLAGNKTESSVITAPGWSKDGVVVEGELYLEKGEKYTLPEGKWKINGDNTVYAGGSVFYAQNEGLYVFTKVE